MCRGCLCRSTYIRVCTKRLASRCILHTSSRLRMTSSLAIEAVAVLVVATVAVMFRRLRSNRVGSTAPFRETVKVESEPIQVEDDSYIRIFPEVSKVGILSGGQREQMKVDKALYWRLQNIEEHSCMSMNIHALGAITDEIRSSQTTSSGSSSPAVSAYPLISIPCRSDLHTVDTRILVLSAQEVTRYRSLIRGRSLSRLPHTPAVWLSSRALSYQDACERMDPTSSMCQICRWRLGRWNPSQSDIP